jgi:UDP-N-acetylmuramate dehydrogenase
MTRGELLAVLGDEFPGRCRIADLSAHTTWRIGGPAVVLEADSPDMLGGVLSFLDLRRIPWFVLGMGSNVLAPSEGTDVAVLRLTGGLAGKSFRRAGDSWLVSAGGGTRLPSLAGAACMLGASGLQFAAGIPGTLGGALVMNAGAYGSEISGLVRAVAVRRPDGGREVLEAGECGFGYRTSRFQGERVVVESAELVLAPGDPGVLRMEAADVLELRRRKLPLDWPNAGSVFRRPDDDHPPGRLIEESGLKGFRVGGAEVSTLHANFVVNKGGASSGDVMAVIEAVRERVFSDSGVSLQEEVVYMPRGRGDA